MEITALYIYPVKSLAGIRVDTLELNAAGPRFDREWMIVDQAGNFVTQRQHPTMQLVRTRLEGDALILEVPGFAPATVSLRSAAGRPTLSVSVWGTTVTAVDEGPAAVTALNKFLGTDYRLVRIAAPGRHEEAAGVPYEVRFADACPLLLCAEASLAELNARAGKVLSIERFRPNIVVRGTLAFAEDTWRGFSAGALHFKSLRPCTRCAVTTVDPVTAARGPEPLKTLATFRKSGNKVKFGQYFLSPNGGTLTVGATLQPEA